MKRSGLLLSLALVVTWVAVQLPALGTSPRALLQTTPPIRITGWSSYTEIAKQLAAALVDTNHFSIVSANYRATSTATAGKATFQQYGTYYLDAGKPPGHLLAPRFPGGAIVLSTAKIVGTSWPNPLQLATNRTATEIPGSVRSVRLELNLKAKSAGYVKSAWAWQDALVQVREFSGEDEELGSPRFSSRSTFRYLVNGWCLHAACNSNAQVP
jgi:hypothetical protein